MSESVIEKTLIAESTTFPQKSVATKVYRHKKRVQVVERRLCSQYFYETRRSCPSPDVSDEK